MEVNVKVTIELGPNTIAALGGIGNASVEAKTVKVKEVAPAKAQAVAPTEEAEEVEAVTKKAPAAATASTGKVTPAQKTVATKPAPLKKAEDTFEDLDEEAQLESIKAHITKHTKKGKTADIKALLSNFGVAKASDLEAEQYGDFNDAITRYSSGESVEDIFPSLD